MSWSLFTFVVYTRAWGTVASGGSSGLAHLRVPRASLTHCGMVAAALLRAVAAAAAGVVLAAERGGALVGGGDAADGGGVR